jgi:hypothetical protein
MGNAGEISASAERRRPKGGFLRGGASGGEIDIFFLRKSEDLFRKRIGIGKTPEPHITEAIA